MKLTGATLLAAITFLYLSNVAGAIAGTPIGGIVVKGGKNPGGQMRALATTDATGKFKIEFVEGGDYKLEFEGTSRKDFGERMKAGLEVVYVLKKIDKMAADAKQEAATSNRHTPFHNKLENGQTVVTVMSRHTPFHNKRDNALLIVTVPTGGGVISGVLQTANASDTDHAAQRSINQIGISVKSPTPKGGVKK